MNLKIKALPKATKKLVGVRVSTRKLGEAGYQIQDIMEREGYLINRGKGPDIPKLGVEIKSRGIEATSAHTIGNIKLSDIISNTWKDSSLYRKSQQIYRVFYSQETGEIQYTKLVDYRSIHVQEILKNSNIGNLFDYE